ncbi:MAG: RNA polymerase sigma-54 factor, partial [Zhongshania aliphaticivorans]
MNSLALQQAQRQSQTLTLGPQLQNSLKILQVPAAELRTSILKELQANPLLEELAINSISIDEYEDKPTEDVVSQENEANFDKDDFSILEHMSEDLREQYGAEDAASQYTSKDSERREYFMNSLTAGVSLQQHLIEQVEFNDFSEQEHEALLYLIGSLNDNGFLTEPISEMATTLQIAPDVVEKAVDILKNFDPTGIGARDLQDCLATQLELDGQADSTAARIVRDYFQLLTRRRIPELAHKLNVSIGIVQEAVKAISRLDPAPGRRFKLDTNTVVEPDVTVYKDEYG